MNSAHAVVRAYIDTDARRLSILSQAELANKPLPPGMPFRSVSRMISNPRDIVVESPLEVQSSGYSTPPRNSFMLGAMSRASSDQSAKSSASKSSSKSRKERKQRDEGEESKEPELMIVVLEDKSDHTWHG